MKKRLTSGFCLLTIMALCASCSILPQEEVYSNAPVVRTYEKEEYELTKVLRGDLSLVRTVRCTYMPVDQEKLAFFLGGELVDRIYVSQGQQVRAGELVAELNTDNLKEQIAGQEYETEVLRTKRKQVQDNLTLEMLYQEAFIEAARQKREAKYRSHPEYERDEEESLLTPVQEEAFARKKVEYAKQMQEIDDELAVREVSLSEMRERLEKSQLYAGIDGTVTYVKTLKDGYRSTVAETVVTVTDIASSAFVVKGEDADLFSEGMEVTIRHGKEELAATVSKFVPAEDEKEQLVYLSLAEPDLTLEDGDKGSIDVTLDFSGDCLYLDKDAVKLSNGETFVYVPDSEGLRTMRTVTTGIENDDYIEITSGLSEGEAVILE